MLVGVGIAYQQADKMIRGAGKFSKIPEVEYNAIKRASVHNTDANSITLGKFSADGKSYIDIAEQNGSSYFSLGDDWGVIKNKYNLTEQEMFEYFNKPFIENAVNAGKTIEFSHDP